MTSCPVTPGCNCDPSEPCALGHKFDGSPNPGVRDLSWWKRRITLNPMVKIERCSDSLMWYTDKVGQEVRVEHVTRDGLWVREGGQYNAINVIRFTDV